MNAVFASMGLLLWFVPILDISLQTSNKPVMNACMGNLFCLTYFFSALCSDWKRMGALLVGTCGLDDSFQLVTQLYNTGTNAILHWNMNISTNLAGIQQRDSTFLSLGLLKLLSTQMQVYSPKSLFLQIVSFMVDCKIWKLSKSWVMCRILHRVNNLIQ